jgi:hypothetical protein
MHKRKIFAVVIRVALDAGRTWRPQPRIRCVKPFVVFDFTGDLAMAFKAAEGRRFD